MKIVYILVLFAVFSCVADRSEKRELVEKWMNKKIVYPRDIFFTNKDGDTVEYNTQSTYKILVHIDSAGCFSCKLKLSEWSKFIKLVDSIAPQACKYLFVFATSKDKELYRNMHLSKFDHPIILNRSMSFNQLNHFPSNIFFQTFLLDRDNKVLAIGNPVLNPKVKELYLKIIQGKPVNMAETDKTPQTTVSIPSTEISMGDFPWQEEQTAVFTLKNTGDKPLVIQDAATSCGCLHVSFTQQPVLPGDEAEVHATYKADNPGYFNKSITVYTNAGDAPMKLRVRGNAMK